MSPLRLSALFLLMPLLGCAEFISALDRSLDQMVVAHPVTGEPMLDVMPEHEEIARAQEFWQQVVRALPAQDIRVDPGGPRQAQLERVFRELVAVAHRQHLPWQVHLIDDPTPNAVTPGGGLVVFFSGIFTDHPARKGFLSPRDDEVAAVLAHEIAHVTLMHANEERASRLLDRRHQKDAYYGAAYDTRQEEQADKLGVLYMALAGYDPNAASTLWLRAHRKYGSDPGLYLYDHPLNVERVAVCQQAASHVIRYYTPHAPNEDWAAILANNPLFPRQDLGSGHPGSGIAKALEAAGKMKIEHDRAKDEAKVRERAANERMATLVQLLAVQNDPQGRPYIWLQFYNGAPQAVSAIGVTVNYMGARDERLVSDPSCGGPAALAPGETRWFSCDAKQVEGATSYQVKVTGAQFR